MKVFASMVCVVLSLAFLLHEASRLEYKAEVDQTGAGLDALVVFAESLQYMKDPSEEAIAASKEMHALKSEFEWRRDDILRMNREDATAALNEFRAKNAALMERFRTATGK